MEYITFTYVCYVGLSHGMLVGEVVGLADGTDGVPGAVYRIIYEGEGQDQPRTPQIPQMKVLPTKHTKRHEK